MHDSVRSLAALALFFPVRASAQEPAPEDGLVLVERSLGVMGTDLEIKVLGTDVPALETAIDAAIRELRRVEDLMTDWRASPLSTLNEAAGRGPQAVPAELLRLIERSLAFHELTGGAFDVTYASAGKLWDFQREPPVIPSDEAIRAALPFIDASRLVVDAEHGTVTLPAGMRIGLGGIAKGYGIDRALAVLMEHGIENAFVSAGGDLKALGRKHGELWRIAVRHPRERERVLAVLPLANVCVSTSGDYERFFLVDGRRYHHILDPRTGRPATGCMSATVVAPESVWADVLATSLCVMDPAEGLALVERLERVEAILVPMDGHVLVSSGLQPDGEEQR
jgi:thiamine biosynthesis lipoprotein